MYYCEGQIEIVILYRKGDNDSSVGIQRVNATQRKKSPE